MSQSFNPKPGQTEADLAYELLQAQGRPMYYYNLIEEVLRQLTLPQDPTRISAVLTQINLDTRFSYIGQGEWGLKAWVPARSSRRLPTITLLNKSVTYDDESEKEAVYEEVSEDLDLLDNDLDEEASYEGEDSFEGTDDEEDDEEIEPKKWG